VRGSIPASCNGHVGGGVLTASGATEMAPPHFVAPLVGASPTFPGARSGRWPMPWGWGPAPGVARPSRARPPIPRWLVSVELRCGQPFCLVAACVTLPRQARTPSPGRCWGALPPSRVSIRRPPAPRARRGRLDLSVGPLRRLVGVSMASPAQRSRGVPGPALTGKAEQADALALSCDRPGWPAGWGNRRAWRFPRVEGRPRHMGDRLVRSAPADVCGAW
jgi:hypothetical protein